MRNWIDPIQARTQAQAKYDKNNTTGFYMKPGYHTLALGPAVKAGGSKKTYPGRNSQKKIGKFDALTYPIIFVCLQASV